LQFTKNAGGVKLWLASEKGNKPLDCPLIRVMFLKNVCIQPGALEVCLQHLKACSHVSGYGGCSDHMRPRQLVLGELVMKRPSRLIRFGVSLERELLSRFDSFVRDKKFPTRSEAIRALIKERLVRKEWLSGGEVAGAIVLVYDHGRREILNRITHVQHECHKNVVSTQHVHLDHDNCLEVIVVKGTPRNVEKLYKGLQAIKGIKHISLNTGTTGREIP
jgi:CopG family nickel-responsive transcriptional regulator